MNRPPEQLDGARLVCFAMIEDTVRPTGKTTHRKDEQVLGPAAGLGIGQYAVLYRLDTNGTIVGTRSGWKWFRPF